MSTRTPRLNKQVQEVIDWEDKYKNLNEDQYVLKKALKEKDEIILKLSTKSRKLESEVSKLELMTTGEVQHKPIKRDREEDNLINTLYDQISKLKNQNSSLTEKNKSLVDQLERKKRELTLAKKISSNYKRPLTAPTKEITATEIEIRPGPTNFHHNTNSNNHIDQNLNTNILTSTNAITPDPNLLNIAKNYKARIAVLEEQLENFKDENARLSQKQRSDNQLPNINGDLESKLRDTKWRLQQLQTQYDFMASKTAAQSQTFKHMESQLEDYTLKISDLRNALKDLQREKEISDIKANQLDELREQNNELLHINKNLEYRIEKLCETPFINDAYKQHEIKLKYEDLMNERNEYKNKIEHLQEAIHTNYSALTNLKNQFIQLKNEKNETINENETLKMKLKNLELSNQNITNQLKLYSDDDNIDVETLERALTLVKRRSNAITKLPFLEKLDDDEDTKDDLLTLPAIKRKYEHIQIVNIQLNDEISRLENILKLQVNINKDLHLELNNNNKKVELEKNDIKNSLQQYIDLSNKRLEKIHLLEAQLRQYIYKSTNKTSTHLFVNKKQNVLEKESDSNLGIQNHLLTDFLNEKDGYIQPDENLLEIWIKSCSYKDNIIKPGASTFIVIDFFDYETQTTTLQTSSKPSFDFAMTYKLLIDDFLIRYLASDVVTVEVNMAIGGDFTLLSRSAIPLNGLLRASPVIQLVNHPLLSIENGELIGHVNLDLRLALPISELYRLFLERHPLEKKFIDDIASRRVIESMTALEHAQSIESIKQKSNYGVDPQEESRLYNELEVTFIGGKNLKVNNNQPPSSYLYFQLLAFPDKFTNPIPHTSEPKYNEIFTFPMITNDYQIRLLRTSRMSVSVIDMNIEGQNKSNDDGLLGEVSVPLVDLSEGLSIHSTYKIKNSQEITGELEVNIKWKYPFRNQRELGPRALSNNDVETIISAFTLKNDQLLDGLIDYKLFCRYINPPKEISRCIENIKRYITVIIENKIKSKDFTYSTPKDICLLIFQSNNDIDKNDSDTLHINEDEFVKKLILTKIDNVLPIDYANLFHYIDINNLGYVMLEQFLNALNLNEVVAIPYLLQDKLKQRAVDLQNRSIEPVKVFEESAETTNYNRVEGVITRSEFKLGLKRLGFTLVDETEPLYYLNKIDESIENHFNLPEKNLLDDTIDSINDISTDDILQPTYRDQLIKENDIQRDIFEKQKDEIIKRSKLANERNNLSNINQIDNSLRTKIHDAIDSNKNENTTHVGINLLAKAQESLAVNTPIITKSIKYPNQRESTLKTDNNYNNNDSDELSSSVTKFQSRYRGYSTRKKLTSPESMDNDYSEIKPLYNVDSIIDNQSTSNPNNLEKFILAEKNLVTNFESMFETLQSFPDLMAKFKIIDKKNVGFVNRQQFAHVIKQFPIINLYGSDLRAMMDYFDLSKEGNHIVYPKFINYCNKLSNGYPKFPPHVELLYNFVMTTNLRDNFTNVDKLGKGLISRADMMSIFITNGYKQIDISVLTSIILLFETQTLGEVNYLNFLDVIYENYNSLKYRELNNQLIIYFKNKGDISDERVSRHFFKLISKDSTSNRFNLSNFSEFIKDLGFTDIPKSSIIALFQTIDKESLGEVTYLDFIKWLQSYQNVNRPIDCELLSLQQIQHKLHLYMMDIAKSESAINIQKTIRLNDIIHIYGIYDVQNDSNVKNSTTTNLSDIVFSHVAKLCGFPLTNKEIEILCNEFNVINQSNSKLINYSKFLSFITPNTSNESTTTVVDSIQNKLSNNSNNISNAIKYLELAMKRGLDLLNIFAKYDVGKVGRINSNDFCAAMSDLGLSYLTLVDAIELANRYKALTTNDYILYRRILSELIKNVDDINQSDNVDIVDTIRAAINLQSNGNPNRLIELFKYYDRQGSGKVFEDDIYTIFSEAGLKLKTYDIEKFCNTYCASSIRDKKNGSIVYTGFIKSLSNRMSKGIKPSADSKPSQLGNDLILKLTRAIEILIDKGRDYRNDFDRYDENFLGSILIKDCVDLLTNHYLIKLSNSDIDSIADIYKDMKDGRRIKYSRLLFDIHPRPTSIINTNEVDSYTLLDIAENLRIKIRRRCDYLLPEELRKPFKHFVHRNLSKNKNIVSYDDFILAIRDLGMKLGSDYENALFNLISISKPIHNENYFTYNDFVVYVCDPYYNDITFKLKKLFHKHHISEREIIDVILSIDSTNSGILSDKQFYKLFQRLQFVDLSDSDLNRLIIRFDENGLQQVNINNFISYLRSIFPSQSSGSILDTQKATDNQLKSSSDLESSLWIKLRNYVEHKLESGYSFNEVFQLFDKRSKGLLDIDSLQLGCREFGLSINRSEARAILRRMSVLIGGVIDKDGFYKALDIDLTMDKYSNKYKDRKKQLLDDEIIDTQNSNIDFISIIGKLRIFIDRLLNKYDDYANSEELFRHILRKHSSSAITITENEFNRSCNEYNIPILSHEISIIFDHLDKDIIGYISIDSIIENIYPSATANRSSTRLREVSLDRDDNRRSSRLRDEDSYTDSKSNNRRYKQQSIDILNILRKRLDLSDILINQYNRIIKRDNNTSLLNLRKIMTSMDKYNTKTLERQIFADCLKRFGFNLSIPNERDLVDSISESNEQGEIRYIEFIDALDNLINPPSNSNSRSNSIINNSSINELILKIKHNIIKEYSNLSKGLHKMKLLFKDCDMNHSDQINEREFLIIMSDLNIELTIQEVKLLFSKIDRNSTGLLNYNEFMQFFEDENDRSSGKYSKDATLSREESRTSYSSQQLDSRTIEETDAIIATIQRRLENNFGSNIQRADRLKQIFDEIDRNGDDKINRRELITAIDKLNINISVREVDQLFLRFDKDRNDDIDYNEYLVMFGQKSEKSLIPRPTLTSSPLAASQSRKSSFNDTSSRSRSDNRNNEETNYLIDSIRRRLENSYGSKLKSSRKLADVFKDIDASGDKRISKQELSKAFELLRINITLKEIDMLFDRFDTNNNGYIDYKEYLQLMGFSSDL